MDPPGTEGLELPGERRAGGDGFPDRRHGERRERRSGPAPRDADRRSVRQQLADEGGEPGCEDQLPQPAGRHHGPQPDRRQRQEAGRLHPGHDWQHGDGARRRQGARRDRQDGSGGKVCGDHQRVLLGLTAGSARTPATTDDDPEQKRPGGKYPPGFFACVEERDPGNRGPAESGKKTKG